MNTDETGEASDDIVGGDAVQVTRSADGGFTVKSRLAAKFADCKGCKDDDHDGLSDAWEDAVLAKLTPMVTFDEDEPLMKSDNHDEFGAIGRVFPAGDKIVVSVMFLYTKDYGAANPICFHTHNHAGDAERAALELTLTGRGDAVSVAAYTTAHEGTEDDQTTIVRAEGQKALEDLAGRWRVYSAQNKHGTYMSKDHCEGAHLHTFLHRFCASEDCAPDGVKDPSLFTELPKIVNVGEPNGQRVHDLAAVGFPGVDAWDMTNRFCGGLKGLSADAVKECPDPLGVKLPKNPFAPTTSSSGAH